MREKIRMGYIMGWHPRSHGVQTDLTYTKYKKHPVSAHAFGNPSGHTKVHTHITNQHTRSHNAHKQYTHKNTFQTVQTASIALHARTWRLTKHIHLC